MVGEKAYTLAKWIVKPGRESEFVDARKALGKTFNALPKPPAGAGILVQSLGDSSTYYSFGPGASAEDIAAMRENPAAQESIQRVMALCTEATPGGFRFIAES